MMAPTRAIRNAFAHFAVFRGRSNRSEYWWFSLAYGVFALGALGLDYSLGTTLIGLLILPWVVPNLAVTVRRLHDTNHSGWLTLLVLLPFGQLAILVLMCVRSDPNANFYGAPPRSLRESAKVKAAHLRRGQLRRPINSMNRRPVAKPYPQVATEMDRRVNAQVVPLVADN
jgi:uncharacterized membrane protein YhaH (DUF805 family)